MESSTRNPETEKQDYGRTATAESGVVNKEFSVAFPEGFWAPVRRRDEVQFGSIGAPPGV
jgi:hypothetical protein